jgi:hypothetical protein
MPNTVTAGLVRGPARIYTAPVGTTLPGIEDIATLKAGTFAGFNLLGRTTEPVVITDEPTIVEAFSQQTSRVLDHAVSQWDTTIETTLRDINLATLADLTHGTVAGDTLLPGLRGRAPSHSYAIVGPWDGGECLIVVERATVQNGLELPFDNTEYSALPITIKVMEGNTLEAGYEVYITVGGDEE